MKVIKIIIAASLLFSTAARSEFDFVETGKGISIHFHEHFWSGGRSTEYFSSFFPIDAAYDDNIAETYARYNPDYFGDDFHISSIGVCNNSGATVSSIRVRVYEFVNYSGYHDTWSADQLGDKGCITWNIVGRLNDQVHSFRLDFEK